MARRSDRDRSLCHCGQ